MRLVTLVFASYLVAPEAHAQGTLIDQSNDPGTPWHGYPWTLMVGDPVGQEFVPTLGGLDFVEAIFTSREGSDAWATMQVFIRESTITGPAVGASSKVTFRASNLGSIQRFDFPSTVPLNPGQTYVMHFFQEAPQNYSIGADPSMGYPSGQMIRSGVPFEGFDLWFWEGMVVVPEPSSFSLALLGLGVFYSMLWRRRNSKPNA